MMNKLKILFGILLIMASLLFTAYPIDALQHPVCMAKLTIPSQVIAGQSAAFDASSSFCYLSGTTTKVPISSYTFNFGDGTTSTGMSPIVTHVFSNPGTFYPAVTVNAQGWQATATVGLAVSEPPSQPVDSNPYVKEPSILPTPIQTSPTFANVPPIITFFDGFPRSGTEPLRVSFQGAAIDLNGDPMTYVLFFDWNRNNSINVTGTIGSSLKTLGSYIYSEGHYLAKMEVSDGKAKFSRTVPVHVNASQAQRQIPVACMTASRADGYVPFSVTFNGSCSYDIDSSIVYHNWRIVKENGQVLTQIEGNGQPGAWQYTFTDAGKYFVYLKVADEQHKANITNVTVVAKKFNITLPNFPPMITSFNADPRFGNEPLTVTFKGSAFDLNHDNLTYTLFFDWYRNNSNNVSGDITSYQKVLGAYTYLGGNYLAKLEVSDGKNKSTRAIPIHVNKSEDIPPVACMTADTTMGCLPLTANFDGSCSYDKDGSIVRHEWRIVDENGQPIAMLQGNGSPTTWQYNFTVQGKYFVYLKVVDEQHKASITNVTVTTEQCQAGPTIGSFRGEPSSGYAPLTVYFMGSAAGTYPLTYTLFFSTSDRSKNATGTINSTDSLLGTFLYISGGTSGRTYQTELVVTDPAGASASKTADIQVMPAESNPNYSQNNCPMVNFTYSPLEIFAGDEVQFTDQSVDSDGNILYWLWQFGDGTGSGDDLVSGAQNPKHAYSSAGNYTTSLKIYDNSGCANLTSQNVEVKEKVVPPQPQPSGGGGGGGGLYLGPPTPAVIIQTSGTGYLDFHPSYALNGTRAYSFDNKTNTTTLTLRIVNLARSIRNFTIRDFIPKDVAASMQEVQIIPVPMTIFNQDPEIGWNVTLAPNQAFEAKYVFKKYIPFSRFESLPRPVITEIVKSEAIPVSPERQVTVAGGITGFIVSSLSNPWVGLIVLAAILAFFFAFTETGREALDSTATRTRAFIRSVMDDLEEPKDYGEDRSERVKKLKKLMKKKKRK